MKGGMTLFALKSPCGLLGTVILGNERCVGWLHLRKCVHVWVGACMGASLCVWGGGGGRGWVCLAARM